MIAVPDEERNALVDVVAQPAFAVQVVCAARQARLHAAVVLPVGVQRILEGLRVVAGQHAIDGFEGLDAGQVGLVQGGIVDQGAGVAHQADAYLGEVGAADDDHVRLDQVELPVHARLVAKVHRQGKVRVGFIQAVIDEIGRCERVDGADQDVQLVAVLDQLVDQGLGAAGEGGNYRDLLSAQFAQIGFKAVFVIQNFHTVSSDIFSAISPFSHRQRQRPASANASWGRCKALSLRMQPEAPGSGAGM
ncbi:hypothetical protein D9M71_467790 [compost metagenome]